MNTIESIQKTVEVIIKEIEKQGLRRARISEKSVRALTGKDKLRLSYIQYLKEEMEGRGYILVELDRGGFGILAIDALEGAKCITFKS